MSAAVHPVEAEVRRRIALAGPMPVAEYMALCLSHPTHGYYISRDPFGREGDFITAPEISQMFGEMIGLWAAAVWEQMGGPENVRLVELGPGRGTLMADALRAAQAAPAFRRALVVHLVETSPKLRASQRAMLSSLNLPMLWHETLSQVPEGPAIIIANEFFDALPIRQAVRQSEGWRERLIGIGDDGRFAFTLSRGPLPHFEDTLPQALRGKPEGAIFEWRDDQPILELAQRITRQPGAALVIDYGAMRSGMGDTLQAVKQHRFANPLETPGEADLTAHVDFQAFGAAAETVDAAVHGPVEQATFLRRLGLDVRAARLMAAAPQNAHEIETGYARLMAGGSTGMGSLFKAMAITAPKIGTPVGFG